MRKKSSDADFHEWFWWCSKCQIIVQDKDVSDGKHVLCESVAKKWRSDSEAFPWSPVNILMDRVKKLEGALRLFAQPANWQSVGTYAGHPSDCVMWIAWLNGIENKPWLIAEEALR
jgi:hypothetical protein